MQVCFEFDRLHWICSTKKHPDASKSTEFVVSFPNRVNGQIKVAMAVP